MQTGRSLRGGRTGWLIPVSIALFSTALQLYGSAAQQWLRFDREAIASGALWRLLSAHFVHLGWSHLLLNLVGLFIIWALIGEAMSNLRWLFLLLFSALFIGLSLWWFDPQLHWYVGLSGLLHAVLLSGAVLLLLGGDKSSWLLILFVSAKLVWEQLQGPLPGSEAASGGAVIVDAHLYGAVAGVLYVGLLRLFWRDTLCDSEARRPQ